MQSKDGSMASETGKSESSPDMLPMDKAELDYWFRIESVTYSLFFSLV